MTHAEVKQLIAFRTEEEMGILLLHFHLPEYLTVGFLKRFVLRYGLNGVICGFERIIEALARNLIGKSAGIAYEDDVGDCRLYRMEGYKRAHESGFRNIEFLQQLTEYLTVGNRSAESIDIVA